MRFLLVDRILELERGKRASGVKNVTMSEEFLAYHFPDMPIMPGVLIVEALVQLADWLIREHSDFTRIGLPIAFDRLKFRHLVRPGDQLLLEVAIVSQDEEQAAVHGTAACNGKTMATANFSLRLLPIDCFLSSEEARRMYRVLTQQ